jgi:hypothetical protein
MRKLTTEEFIEESKIIHNDKYIYDKTIFTRKKDKVIIICPIHGEFSQIADNHIRGNGCIKCSGKEVLSLDEFIRKANIKHNNMFDYSITEYKNCKSKVNIICPIHGIFEQLTSNHLYGFGCSKCANNIKITNIEFENKSNVIHNNKYSYTKINYINCKTKIIITCPNHGDFKITPSNHLKGIGCSKCSNKYKPTTIEFIEKCRNIHNDKYDYSKVDYKNNRTNIEIICKKHGIFKQRPTHHLDGVGCPGCYKSSGEQLIETYLNNKSIKFKSEYTFDNLKIKKPLRFDFAIIDNNNNLKFLIEYNGIQHYEFRCVFHKSEKYFEESLIRDNIKIKYCVDNNIKLYIISYKDNLIERLEEIINENEKEN